MVWERKFGDKIMSHLGIPIRLRKKCQNCEGTAFNIDEEHGEMLHSCGGKITWTIYWYRCLSVKCGFGEPLISSKNQHFFKHALEHRKGEASALKEANKMLTDEITLLTKTWRSKTEKLTNELDDCKSAIKVPKTSAPAANNPMANPPITVIAIGL